jgi:alpha-mannosidase
MAKYEICAHKWVDLSQGDYGVALLNDCKYGYKVLENVIDLNLLRSPGHPDPTADRVHHEFTYSLYPHRGDHISGEVVKAAYELNIPLKILATKAHKGKLPANKSFIKVGAESIIVETVKKAEDNNNMIIRLYEAHGVGTRTKIHFNFEAKIVQLVDIMEENAKLITLDGKSVELYFRPFEIHTLKISV